MCSVVAGPRRLDYRWLHHNFHNPLKVVRDSRRGSHAIVVRTVVKGFIYQNIGVSCILMRIWDI